MILLSTSLSFSQSLQGKWEGWFTFNNNSKDTAIIKLQFRLNKDSTYEVYSFSEFGNNKSVCKLSYKMLKKHSVYLEEKELLRANHPSVRYLFQKMTLTIAKDFASMKGKWFDRDGLSYSGDILFIKKM